MVSRNVEHLQEHGPSTLPELPNDEVSTGDKQNGVWRFYRNPLSSRWKGNSTPAHVKPVYYLKGNHDRAAVLVKFFEENPGMVPDSPQARGALGRHLDDDWKHAIGEALDRVDDQEVADV